MRDKCIRVFRKVKNALLLALLIIVWCIGSEIEYRADVAPVVEILK